MLLRLLVFVLLLFIASGLAAWFVTTQPFVRPLPSQPPAADPARMRANVQALSEKFYPRSHDHPGKLAAAAAHIRDAFKAAGGEVAEQEVRVEGERFVNIIARFGPQTGPLLVIGAHYDSHGDSLAASKSGRSFTRDTHTPGADDNASGVAGLIELAYLLGKNPPARPVELVAYTLEEPPHFRTEHMGSAWHARSLASGKRPVELMLSLEMIGYFSDAEGSQSYPLPVLALFYPKKGDFIAVVSRLQDWSETRKVKAAMAGATDLPVFSINALPVLPGIDFSDHRNYWNHGVPGVMITDTAFYRNTEYHRRGDTYDRLDYGRMAKVVEGVYALAARRSAAH